MTDKKDKRIFWHTLGITKKKEILNSKPPVGDFLEQYKQPSWCGYPGDALAGLAGCWSLMVSLLKVTKKSCKDCEFFNGKKKINEKANDS